MDRFDVVVIGGSMAGLNAAYYAAKAGASVLLLERNKEIGCDVRCAEGVVEDIIWDAEMPTHIVDEAEDTRLAYSEGKGPYEAESGYYLAPYMASTIMRVRFRVFGRRYREHRLELKHKRGYVLDRRKFEQALARRAQAAGAGILCGVSVNEGHINLAGGWVEVETSVDRIRKKVAFRTLIGADGVSSAVGRASKLTGPLEPGDIGKAVQYTVRWTSTGGPAPWDPNRIDIDWNWNGIVGYGWVFPKGPLEANVGLGLAGQTPENMHKLLDAYCQNLGLIWGTPGTAEHVRFVGKSIPLARPPPFVAAPVRLKSGAAVYLGTSSNVMLVGDASRACLAHLGAGIGAALISGRMAGENWDYPQAYQRWYDANWRPRAERAWRAKERYWESPGGLLRWAWLLKLAHRLAPKLTETYAFRRMRYTRLA